MNYLQQRMAHILADRPIAKKEKQPLRRISPKRQAKLNEQAKAGTDGSLDQWFEERRKEMTGKCAHCGGKSCKDSDEYYRFSLHHILPKAYFLSVATHPSNFLELCFWGNNCHGNADNKILDLTDMNCFDTIIERFQAMYPSIAQEEKRRIPEVLMNYIDMP